MFLVPNIKGLVESDSLPALYLLCLLLDEITSPQLDKVHQD